VNWKDVANLIYILAPGTETPRKTSVRIVSVLANIWTRHLPIPHIRRYHLNQIAWQSDSVTYVSLTIGRIFMTCANQV